MKFLPSQLTVQSINSKRLQSKPKWHLIYYLLAAFDLLTVCTSLYLNHQVMARYTESVQVNQEWTARLQGYSELGQLAVATNAPGNDVFGSGDVNQETEKLAAAIARFDQKLDQIQIELQNNLNLPEFQTIQKLVQEIDRSVHEVENEARLIFSYVEQNQLDRAGQHMAVMDREYTEVSQAIADLTNYVGQVQQEILERQNYQALQLKRYEYVIAVSIVIMVVGVTIYGHKLARQIESDAKAREQLIEELQKAEIELKFSIEELNRTQAQMVQSEKMSALGQMVSGIAHEINNPVNFIHGNLGPIRDYIRDFRDLIEAYHQHYPQPPASLAEKIEAIDPEFLAEDLNKILQSMQVGTTRIREIVLSLRNFSRLDESDLKPVDIHQGLDSTIMILRHRLKPKAEHPEIHLIQNYGALPLVECYAGQLNQVFMNLLSNAIDALEEANRNRSFQDLKENPSQIRIETQTLDNEWAQITIADNGPGIPETVQPKLFDPFFTTKPIGKGTGLGLSISYQIITEKHGGKLYCRSQPGQGTEFVIEIPIHQKKP